MGVISGFFSGEPLAVFPTNGLDQSLHAPVLVGLFVLTFFREALGWGYAGLVVPGYLATVFLAAPLTGGLMVAEGLASYFLALILARVAPRTGAWSELFGRERFLFIILCALLMRLVMEAHWVPWLVERYELKHSRELYSIGLVLVPLLANSFWNQGLIMSLPRVTILVILTLVFVDEVLLAHTNFTLARFQIANESVSLAFLDTPHAYIILVLGALIAARDNVAYGWDYNGILVPALLAVAWYEPVKLVTTVVEALVVLFLARGLASVKPFSLILMVGSRRMLLVYAVGFLVKWALGFAALAAFPTLQTIDYFGFGYLLPSLLAVKLWNTDKIGRVMMPTLQVSLTAFLLGNGLSILLGIIDPPRVSGAQGAGVESGLLASLELMRGDTAPAPHEVHVPWGELTLRQQGLALAVELMTRGAPAPGNGFSPRLRVSRSSDGWFVMGPRTLDPSDDRSAPRLSLRRSADSSPWLVVVDRPDVGSAAVPVGVEVGRLLRARAVVVRSRLESEMPLDDALVEELARRAGITEVIVVAEVPLGSQLSVVGRVPSALPLGELERSLGVELPLRFRASEPTGAPYANRPRLVLSRELAERAAARLLGAPEPDVWPEPTRGAISLRGRDLTSVLPGRFERPPSEELRLFGALARRFVARKGAPPVPYERALAGVLGYRFARVGPVGSQPDAWALFEPQGDERRGQATLLVRQRAGAAPGLPLVVELPAPRYERGAFDAALTFYDALDADGLLVAGALPRAAPDHAADPRRAQGRALHYQVLHEIWLQSGGTALSVHGIAPGALDARESLVAFGRPRQRPLDGPEWTRGIVEMLNNGGFDPGVVDGSPALESYSGSLDPPMAYARRFSEERMLLVWLSEEARLAMLDARSELVTAERLARAGVTPRETDVVRDATSVLRCLGGRDPGCNRPAPKAECDPTAVVTEVERYNERKNPHDLGYALSLARHCRSEALKDRRSGRLWLSVEGADHAFLVPLRHGSIRPRRAPAEAELARAVALGVSALRLGGKP
jgi:gamma-polyglutamate biosynthesis protein CapC